MCSALQSQESLSLSVTSLTSAQLFDPTIAALIKLSSALTIHYGSQNDTQIPGLWCTREKCLNRWHSPRFRVRQCTKRCSEKWLSSIFAHYSFPCPWMLTLFYASPCRIASCTHKQTLILSYSHPQSFHGTLFIFPVSFFTPVTICLKAFSLVTPCATGVFPPTIIGGTHFPPSQESSIEFLQWGKHRATVYH